APSFNLRVARERRSGRGNSPTGTKPRVRTLWCRARRPAAAFFLRGGGSQRVKKTKINRDLGGISRARRSSHCNRDGQQPWARATGPRKSRRRALEPVGAGSL